MRLQTAPTGPGEHKITQIQQDKMQRILRSIPDEAAVSSGMLRRKRKLTGSALILVLGWLENPEASCRDRQHPSTETAAHA